MSRRCVAYHGLRVMTRAAGPAVSLSLPHVHRAPTAVLDRYVGLRASENRVTTAVLKFSCFALAFGSSSNSLSDPTVVLLLLAACCGSSPGSPACIGGPAQPPKLAAVDHMKNSTAARQCHDFLFASHVRPLRCVSISLLTATWFFRDQWSPILLRAVDSLLARPSL